MIARIPLPGWTDRFYTVEARRTVSYDSALPRDAVIIHDLDTTRSVPALLIDSDANGNTRDLGAMWLPGERFSDAASGVSVTVDRSTATGFVVTIETTSSADRLAFVAQPGNAAPGSALAPQPLIEVRDVGGGRRTSFAGLVTLHLKESANPNGAALLGTLTVNAVAGLATFGEIAIARAGSGYILVATSGNIIPAESAALTISGGVTAAEAWANSRTGEMSLEHRGAFRPGDPVRYIGRAVNATGASVSAPYDWEVRGPGGVILTRSRTAATDAGDNSWLAEDSMIPANVCPVGVPTCDLTFSFRVLHDGRTTASQTTLSVTTEPSLPCRAASLTAYPSGPVPAGTAVSLRAAALDCFAPLFEFRVQPTGGTSQLIQELSAANVATWNTSGLAGGIYTLGVRARPAGGEGESSGSLPLTLGSGAGPLITGTQPITATAGQAALRLTILGERFTPDAVVHWNGAARATEYEGYFRLYITLSVAELASAGTATITVRRPSLAQTSNPWDFPITGTPAAGPDVWSTVGPEGGRVTAVVLDPLTLATLYAATGGGVFRSTDSGGSWQTRNAGLPCCFVTALALDPRAPATLYAAVNGSGVQISTDAGATWNAAGTAPNAYINTLAASAATAGTLFVGTNAGVFRSTNSGSSWQAFNSGLPAVMNVRTLALHPTAAGTLYAAGQPGVFKSTDNGATWAASNAGLTTPDVQAIALDTLTPATLYAGTYGGGVFKSANGGASWAAVNTGISYPFLTSLALDPLVPGTVYAGTFFGVFKSTNGGESWSALNSGLTNLNAAALAAAGGTAYAATTTAVYKTAGGAWTASTSGMHALDTRALVYSAGSTAALYAGTSGGVFKSTDNGATWNLTGASTPFVLSMAADPLSANTLYAGTTGGVHKTNDGGASWSAVNTGLGLVLVDALAVDPLVPATLYAGTPFGVFKSSNAGASWNAATSGLTGTVQALAVHPTAAGTLYAGTSSGLFKSTNGGTNWTAAASGITTLDVRGITIDRGTPATLYAATFGGSLFKSTNGAASWALSGAALSSHVAAVAISPTSNSVLYAAAYNLGVFKSVNGGRSWFGLSGGISRANVDAIALSPADRRTLFAGAFDSGVRRLPQSEGDVFSGVRIPDVNGDGGVTAVDALCVLRELGGFAATNSCPSPLALADVNGDSAVTAVDSLCVLRYIGAFAASASCPATQTASAAAAASEPAAQPLPARPPLLPPLPPLPPRLPGG